MLYVWDQVQDDRSRRALEAGLVTVSVCAYSLAFPVLFDELGSGSSALAGLPVLLTAWLWGWRAGIAAAMALSGLLNPFLLVNLGEAGRSGVASAFVNAIPLAFVMVIAAASVGCLRDLRLRVNRLNAESQEQRREIERDIRDRAEELLRLKSAFLNNMSHELRTPLTAILGFAEILTEEADSTHREFAERILSSGIRLQHTLDSVLDFAQLEGGALKLDVQRLNVGGHVRAIVDCFAAAAERKGLDLTIRVPDEPVEAELDPASLHRIIGCLVENALKFTTEGYVEVDVTADESRVSVCVRDSGIGISDSFLPHVFSEFRQESMGHARSYEGSGLGLSVTKRLVELLGGSITVRSCRGEGSAFSVSFPRAERQNGALVRPNRAPTRLRPTADHRNLNHVLVLDDSSDTLALTQHQLRHRFVVKTADDPETAIAVARMSRFDALVLDIGLRGERNGVEVLRTLRSLDAYRSVPAVALTAYSMPGDRERYLKAGFDAYLSKPFTKQQIMDTLDHLLASRTAA